MRFVNTATLQLESFPDCHSVQYAILSHTWGSPSEEVTLQDVLSGDAARLNNSGWEKIRRASAIAAKSKYKHIWVDTCCIDKTSSAELQEAINSMFVWYAEAAVCYAYLADVEPPPGRKTWPGPNRPTRPGLFNNRWVTRGWTLQELIAPRQVVFFDREWGTIGLRSWTKIAEAIAAATGIRDEFVHISRRQPDLSGTAGERHVDFVQATLASVGVAERLSWAATRSTTRIEDGAYCLLGIFGIHMPMLYGEGRVAFRRLQQKILKRGEDHSLLAYGYGLNLEQIVKEVPAIITTSQALFSGCGTVQSLHHASHYNPSNFVENSSTMTQRGLQIRLPLLEDEHYRDLVYGVLNCHDRRFWKNAFLAVPLIPSKSLDSIAPNRVPPGYVRLSGSPLRVEIKGNAAGLNPRLRTSELVSFDQISPRRYRAMAYSPVVHPWCVVDNRLSDCVPTAAYPPQPLYPGLFDYERRVQNDEGSGAAATGGQDLTVRRVKLRAVLHFAITEVVAATGSCSSFNDESRRPVILHHNNQERKRPSGVNKPSLVILLEETIDKAFSAKLALTWDLPEPSLSWLQDTWASSRDQGAPPDWLIGKAALRNTACDYGAEFALPMELPCGHDCVRVVLHAGVPDPSGIGLLMRRLEIISQKLRSSESIVDALPLAK